MDTNRAMTWAILSTDPDFIAALTKGLSSSGMEVYAATSWEEYARLQEEGAVFEAVVVDPICRVGGDVASPS
ncbi:hypothetical protein ACFL6X_09625 [Candidatus Latescibacterota bacterium]